MLKDGIEQDTEQAIELLSRLIATPSLSTEEGPAADVMEEFLRGHNAEVHRDFAVGTKGIPDFFLLVHFLIC